MKNFTSLFFTFLLGALISNSAFAQLEVETIATDPIYPTMDAPITIYVNINHWPDITSDTLSAYTGLVSSESDGSKGWSYVKNTDWNDFSLVMDRVQDSIYAFVIDNPRDFYGLPEGVETYRITFIARGLVDGANQGQTEDYFLEVYGSEPSNLFNLQPAAPTDKEMICVTWNVNANSDRNDLKGNTDSLWVHTWINGGSGPSEGSGNWPDNSTKFACERVNDSILRWFIAPNVRELYKFKPWTYAESIGVLLRNKEGNAQTNDFPIPLLSERDIDLSSVSPVLVLPPYPTVNDEIAIYLNTNNWDFDTENSFSTAYTGLITSASTDITDSWQHVANSDWNDTSLKMEKINDSIAVFVINDVQELYSVNKNEEEVFRITFIARETSNADSSITAQTENLYFEVYGGDPSDTVQTQPALPSEDDAIAYTFNISAEAALTDYVATEGNDSIFIYTWLNTDDGEGFGVSEWADVSDNSKLKTIAVNDSIFRFFVPKSVRQFYAVEDSCTHVQSTNLILRNAAGTVQSANIYVDVTSNDVVCDGVGFDMQSAQSSLKVYPNPSSDFIHIEYLGEDANTAHVELFTLSGKKILSQPMDLTNDECIDVSSFQKGVYLLNIRTFTKSINSTVIIK